MPLAANSSIFPGWETGSSLYHASIAGQLPQATITCQSLEGESPDHQEAAESLAAAGTLVLQMFLVYISQKLYERHLRGPP